MKRKNFKKVANDIAIDSLSWNQQFEVFAPDEIKKRRMSIYSIKNIIKMILSIIQRPKINSISELYIFQGIRYKDYIKVFNPETVVVVGSYEEKNYAESHGLKFCWSYPIENSIKYKVYTDFNVPLINQIKFWFYTLSKSRKIIFFLNEDTQPLGLFFVHLGRMMKSKATSVCIQHGIFYNMKSEIRVDGALSDANFVWEYSQAEVIKCNRASVFEIGLPYLAEAKLTDKLSIILVGTGNTNIESYNNIINIYENLLNELRIHTDIKIFYRPHPNEYFDQNIINKIYKIFPNIDKSNKITLLNGPRAIFIGTISSILYEAFDSGHLVARLKIKDEITCNVLCDFSFEYDEVYNLIKWIYSVQEDNLLKKSSLKKEKLNPVDRFISALLAAKIFESSKIL
jgi:hypothetical protein